MCTHITKTYYPPNEYARLTPAEKQKVWQLKNASKTNVTPAKRSSSGSRVSAVSSLSMPAANSDDDDLFPDNSSGGNRSNKALARQTSNKKQNKGD